MKKNNKLTRLIITISIVLLIVLSVYNSITINDDIITTLNGLISSDTFLGNFASELLINFFDNEINLSNAWNVLTITYSFFYIFTYGAIFIVLYLVFKIFDIFTNFGKFRV